MMPKLWLLAPFLLALSGCFETLPAAPGKIDPPPANLTMACVAPGDLVDGATALELSKWVAEWIDVYGCERSKRAALIEAWPK